MKQLTNNHNIPLLLAAWLMSDEYDYIYDPNYISVTTLMKPLQEIVLGPRAKDVAPEELDISDRIASALGSSVHGAVERVWETRDLLEKSLIQLGFDVEDINSIEVNPKLPDPSKEQVYIEQRSFKKIEGFTVGGKFDAVLGGIVHDIKTTSVWAWIKSSRDDDYRLQGSIYRWLNQDKITEDVIRVCFLFTDWQKGMVGTVEGYPETRCAFKDIELMSIQETEKWVRNRLKQIKKLRELPAEEMPPCTDEEVWLEKPTYKYYSNPLKTDGRATKNFDNHLDAIAYLEEKGKGVVLTSPPRAKKCKDYCNAFLVCKQKDNFVFD
ncbi:hypothetical protein ZC03_009 [Pseudomonas phage ZC03]|uniref:PD-(D/E)XK endonuclease-like domain-containing protein n=1 Tax=Pseudomonas phage ZC03 TaxID=1622115 RepID=A0A1L2C943_9CAUD|nr:exonuclease [Pseudomonas phage ZC03]AMD43396.1 hypothetical protein ZC03_009 [Pseudomonas phage ZC03]